MKNISDMRVVLLSPMMFIDWRWIKSTVNLMAYSWMQGLQIHEMGATYREVVDWARNNLVRAAQEKKPEYGGESYTHYLWIDTDHVFNPDLAVVLAQDMVAYPQYDIISALYFSRTEPYLPVAYVKDETDDPYKHYPLMEVPNAICEVDAVGFGAVMIKAEVFKKVPDPWFTLDYRAGEDIAFCKEARARGVRIAVDGRYKLGHIGEPQVVTEATCKEFLAAHPERFGEKIRVAL